MWSRSFSRRVPSYPFRSITAAIRTGNLNRWESSHDNSWSLHAELGSLTTAAGMVVGTWRGYERCGELDLRSHELHRRGRDRISRGVRRLGEERQIAQCQPGPCLVSTGGKNRSAEQLLLRDPKCGRDDLWHRLLSDFHELVDQHLFQEY